MVSLKERVVESYKTTARLPKIALMYGASGAYIGYGVAKRTGNKKLGVCAGVAYTLGLPALNGVLQYVREEIL